MDRSVVRNMSQCMACVAADCSISAQWPHASLRVDSGYLFNDACRGGGGARVVRVQMIVPIPLNYRV